MRFEVIAAVLTAAVVLGFLSFSHMHISSHLLPHASNDRHSHVHHSYLHNVLYMLHLEEDDTDPQGELGEAFRALDEALVEPATNQGVHSDLGGSAGGLSGASGIQAHHDLGGHLLDDIYERQQLEGDTADKDALHHSLADALAEVDGLENSTGASEQSIPLSNAHHELLAGARPSHSWGPNLGQTSHVADALHQPYSFAAEPWASELSSPAPSLGGGLGYSAAALAARGTPPKAVPRPAVLPRSPPPMSMNRAPVIVTKQVPAPQPSAPVQAKKDAGANPHKLGPNKASTECSGKGVLLGGKCHCTTLWAGDSCQQYRDITKFKILRKMQSAFKGAITMSKAGLAGKKELRVFLPGKEKDPDGGNRVLGKVSSGLLNAVEQRDIFAENVFENCAVVGSSGIVHHFSFGKEIDGHDLVLRFNSAPTKGFEKFVGSRTTHRITNTQNWVFRESNSEHIMVHMRSTSSLTAVIRTHLGDKSVKLAPFDTDFVHYMANSLDFMATSGLYGIIIALHRCVNVDLYGFQVAGQHGAKYHYYNVCDQPANAERDGAEWHVVKAIVESGLARFREPCVMECHESKGKCEDCKSASGFTKVTNFGKAERGKCPRCSTQYGGCRPPQHWAFRRRWTPPKGAHG